MDKILKKEIDLTSFFAKLDEKSILQKEKVILLGISGGIDSVVLMQACLECNIKPMLVHCNFGLRGVASDKDEIFVQQLAKKNHLKFISKKIIISTDENIQLQARNARYQWFNELLNKYSSHCMLLAHHLTDQTETILINLVRGTGLNGLHLPFQSGKFYRPLLSYTKQDIIDFAEKRNLKWNEDESNKKGIYQRNRVRHQVLPILEKISPTIHRVMKRNVQRFEQTQYFVDRGINEIVNQFVNQFDGGLQIEVRKINNFLGYNIDAFILHKLLKEYQFSYKQCVEMMQKSPKKGAFSYNSDKSFRLYFGEEIWYLISQEKIEPKGILQTMNKINISNYRFEFEILNKSPIFEHSDFYTAHISFDKINWPLNIRVWKYGDKFSPFGMKGTQNVSKFLTNLKVPNALKYRQLVLTDQKQIIWVVGKRISDKVKIENQHGRVLIVKCINNKK